MDVNVEVDVDIDFDVDVNVDVSVGCEWVFSVVGFGWWILGSGCWVFTWEF